MAFNPCLNTYNNINYRQRSQTLQPIRGDALADRQFIMEKYFKSQMPTSDPNRANYANVPPDADDLLHHQLRRQHPRTHQHVHSRSHSQHYYHTMRQVGDPNNYYNIGSLGATLQPCSRHPSPINDARPLHNQIDAITIMQVCVELGNLDSPPPMPSPRTYTISQSRDHVLYKIPFPHNRTISMDYSDLVTGIKLRRGTPVVVLGPAKDDRSKFEVCYNVEHIDIPHQFTQPPYPLPAQWS